MSIPEGLPVRTLGWGVLDWCSRWLAQPDGDHKGQRWVFTDEQAMFILWFYAVDEDGNYLYRRAVLERPKGWGKSPLLAAICCAELLGPTKFSHFNEEGFPVGRPYPSSQVQIAAISEDQTDNTMTLVGEMLEDGGAKDRYRLDIGLSRVLAPGGRKLSRVTASPKSREGNRPTFIVMDETHHWTPAEHGPELAGVLRRNLAKVGGRSIETTNAPVPGQMSVAESSHDAYEMILAGTSFDNTLLFDSREEVVDDIYDKEQAFPALIKVYGDAADPQTGWINLDRIWAEINDPATTEADARRYYFNQRVADAAQWIRDSHWKKATRPDNKLNHTRDMYVLGVKSITRECAAVVACRVEDGAIFLLNMWEAPPNTRNEWEVPVHMLDALVRSHLTKPNCVYAAVDPWTIQDVAGRWGADFEDKSEGVWLSQNLRHAKLVDSFQEALYGDRLHHNGDPDLARHIKNSYLEEVTNGYKLRKERPYSDRYIVGALASLLAWEARSLAIENGVCNEPSNQLYGF